MRDEEYSDSRPTFAAGGGQLHHLHHFTLICCSFGSARQDKPAQLSLMSIFSATSLGWSTLIGNVLIWVYEPGRSLGGQIKPSRLVPTSAGSEVLLF
jgi:hypothetical protein